MKTKSSASKNKKCGSMPQVTPRFPPDITAINLIEKAITKLDNTGQLSRVPNAFIAYRMAFCKELGSMKHPVITQPKLSSMVKDSWAKEPENVRKEYQRIAAEARDIYRQMCQERLPSFIESEYQSQFTYDNLISQTIPQPYTCNFYDPFAFPSNSDNLTIPFSSTTQDYSNSPFSNNDNLDDSTSSLSSNYDSSILPQVNCEFCKGKIQSLQEKIQTLEQQLEKLTDIVSAKSILN
ncbi:9435_t:CDS:2 [Ambispora gerdemannii]|uniref:9435_t:CDS:1 n=1 Tax=Ambispora gerdemannii TaxID=144530 RepID=A0A9N8ZV51_9GLOM|nr:9435_t:CDS:2 [Ambispora gerdemannii]